MMFVQSEKLESEHLPSTEKLNIPTKGQKKDMTLPQITTETYTTKRRGNPLPCPDYDTNVRGDTNFQRNRGFFHAIIRGASSESY